MSELIESPSAYVRAGMLQAKSETKIEVGFARLALWVARNEARPFMGRECLQKLVNPRHHCNRHACYDPNPFVILDHVEYWRGNGGRFILTAHPYGPHGYLELERWVTSCGLSLAISRNGSWYFPGNTWLIEIIGKTA